MSRGFTLINIIKIIFNGEKKKKKKKNELT